MTPTPNIIAYLALWLCVPITLALYFRFRPPLACALAIIGSAMFMPELMEFDLPLLPPLDKVSLPALGALLGALFFARERVQRARAFRGVDLLFVLIVVGSIPTVLTNRDAIPYENGVMEPLTAYDIVAGGIRDLLEIFAPFFLGRALFTTRRDLYTFATVMAGAGLVYSLCVLIEARMSPQLHNWIYGYHQHRFDQTFRFGGWRPMIFMTHGLNAARFMVGTLLCAVALARARRKVWNVPATVWVVYLVCIVALCRSAGAWVLGAVGLAVIYFTTVKAQVRFATALAGFVLLYPVLRAADWVPVDEAIEFAEEHISADRASSLEDRFEQEDLLLDKMRARAAFGWGPGIRYSLWDPLEGEMATIDGQWLHVFGRGGMWRFACLFGLYLAPVWAARKYIARLRPGDARLLAALVVMMALWAFDNIPNSTGTLPQLFMAGVVYGATRGLAAQTALEKRKAKEAARRAPLAGSTVDQSAG